MQLSPIATRLDTQVTAARHVAIAANLEYLLQDIPGKPMPALYLVAPTEKAGANGVAAGAAVRQRVADRFEVALVVRNVSDARGQAALAELDSLRGAVCAALLGWVPAAGQDALLLESGRLLYAGNGWAVWNDVYTSQHYAIANL